MDWPGIPPREVQIKDFITRVVDCGCCTLSGEALRAVTMWWAHLHPGGALEFTPEDESAIDAAYNFAIWHMHYSPGRRAQADDNWIPRGRPGHQPVTGNTTGGNQGTSG